MSLKTSAKDGIPVLVIIGTNPSNIMNNEHYFQVVKFPLCITNNVFVLGKENINLEVSYYYNLTKKNPIKPVVLKLPLDVSQGAVKQGQVTSRVTSYINTTDKMGCNSYHVEELIHAIKKADKPLIVIGAGVLQANAEYLMVRFISQVNIPAVSTFAARGILDEDDKLFVGCPGVIAIGANNNALIESDLIIAFGSSLSDRFMSPIKNMRKLMYKIDIRRETDSNNFDVISIECDVKQVLNQLLKSDIKKDELWICNNNNLQFIPSNQWCISYGIKKVIDNAKPSIIFCDDGTYTIRLWQIVKVKTPRSLLFSGNMATDGHALPGGIGASLANNGAKVLVITGDG